MRSNNHSFVFQYELEGRMGELIFLHHFLLLLPIPLILLTSFCVCFCLSISVSLSWSLSLCLSIYLSLCNLSLFPSFISSSRLPFVILTFIVPLKFSLSFISSFCHFFFILSFSFIYLSITLSLSYSVNASFFPSLSLPFIHALAQSLSYPHYPFLFHISICLSSSVSQRN